MVLVGLLWYWTRQRNAELFQSGITVKNTTCTAEMPERTYNPAPIPASTPIPNIRIDITPYIQGYATWKIDLMTIVNYYAPNAGSVKSEDQTALYNERLVPLLTYRNITTSLFQSKNLMCWRDHTRVCLYLMNCNSMILPFMTKAASITSLTNETARRNNFKELLKEPNYAFLNVPNPFGLDVYKCPHIYFIYRNQDTSTSGTYDNCLSTSNAIKSSKSALLAGEAHQGNFEVCHVLFRLMAQVLLMRVNISELTESAWHNDLDEISSWMDKLAQYLATRFRENNIHLIRTVPLMIGSLMNCRKLTIFSTELEKFFDAAFGVKEGFIWTETNRDVMVINYHLYFLSMLWIIFIIFEATGTPFAFAKYKTLLKKIVDNGVVEVYMQEKITAKRWTAIQFHDVMATALGRMGITYTNGSLQGLTSGTDTSCFFNPTPPCGAPAPAISTTVNCNCTMKKITFDFIMNAIDTITPPAVSTTTTPYFTVSQMKVLMFHTCLGDFAKQQNCPPITLTYLTNARTLDFYKYFYEGGPLPSSFTTSFPMSPNEFINALKKWVEVEKTVP